MEGKDIKSSEGQLKKNFYIFVENVYYDAICKNKNELLNLKTSLESNFKSCLEKSLQVKEYNAVYIEKNLKNKVYFEDES